MRKKLYRLACVLAVLAFVIELLSIIAGIWIGGETFDKLVVTCVILFSGCFMLAIATNYGRD